MVDSVIERLRWATIEVGDYFGRHRHAGEMIVPVVYQCVAKRVGAERQLVLMELCFALEVEKTDDGTIIGSAHALPGHFASGVPVIAKLNERGELIVAGLQLERRDENQLDMRFKVSEQSHYLRLPSGKRRIRQS